MPGARRIFRAMVVVGLTGLVAAVGTYAAFSSPTSNGSNAFAAGTVSISDNDAGGSLMSLSNAKPGASSTGCIVVTYGGTLDSTVVLYGSTTGSLAPYLSLSVTRGTSSGPFNSCAGFTADVTNYIGAGPGIIYSGTVSSFPTSYATGLVDPTAGSPETWTTSEVHAYMFVVSLVNDPAAQALSSTASFTWEARNS